MFEGRVFDHEKSVGKEEENKNISRQGMPRGGNILREASTIQKTANSRTRQRHERKPKQSRNLMTKPKEENGVHKNKQPPKYTVQTETKLR